jgi:TonB-linked SusC/RagA family outer membrane protein
MFPFRTVKALSKSLATAFLGTAMLFGAFPLASGQGARAQEAELARIAGVKSGGTSEGAPAPQQQTVALSQLETLPAALDQTIALQLDEATLEEALKRIARQTDLEFVYGQDVVAPGVQITTDVEAISARAALERVLRGTGRTLVLSESGQLILTTASSASLQSADAAGVEPSAMPRGTLQKMQAVLPQALRADAEAKQGAITGTVTDADTGEPLPGVSVAVEGTQLGAATGADGTYQIPGVEPGTYTVRASFVGYGDETEQAVEVSEGATTTVDFTMTQAVESLDEVVVVGYGEQQRRDLTGAVSSVSSEEIEDIAVNDPALALQGRTPGVRITQNSGNPGEGARILVRGRTTLGNNSPLVVVDGQITSSGLDAIDPNNIESVSLLKGASATAIYGSRASAGVVLVETKRGTSGGEPEVSFRAYRTSDRVAKKLDLLDRDAFVEVNNEAAVNSGSAPVFGDDVNVSSLPDTDWQDQIFRTGHKQNYQLSVSGGTEGLNYYVSGAYYRQEGVLRGTDLDRYNLRVKGDYQVSEAFKIGNSISLSRVVDQEGATNAMLAEVTQYPPAVGVRQEDGSLAPGPTYTGIPPLLVYDKFYNNQTNENRLLGNVYGEYEFIDGLTLRSSLGVDYESSSERNFTGTWKVGNKANETANLNRFEGSTRSLLNENTLRYERLFGESHDLEALAGYTIESFRSEGLNASRQDFPGNDDFLRVLDAGSGSSSLGGSYQEWAIQSVLGRLNYTFRDRYLLTATVRADGSSRFAEGNRWGAFPSFALAWRVSEEPFMDGLDAVSNLKLRGSWGQIGNQEIGIYPYQTTVDLGQFYVLGDGQSLVPGIAPTSLGNPDLSWETTTTTNLGVDLGLFEERLTLTADYYIKNTSDILVQVPVPFEVGVSGAPFRNVGEVRNTGVEFAVTHANTLGEDFSYDLSANASYNTNEVTELGRDQPIIDEYNGSRITIITQEGSPINSIYGYEVVGVFPDEAAVENAPTQEGAGPGDLRYADTNDDGKITPADRTVLGQAEPDWTFGLSGGANVWNFDLSFVFYGEQGKELYRASQATDGINPGEIGYGRLRNRWTPQNRNTSVPRVGSSGNNNFGRSSSFFTHSADFLRLKNLQVGYTLPQRLTESFRVDRLRIYAGGLNLFTISNYEGYNPEQTDAFDQQGAGSYPIPRSYQLGVQLRF